MYSNIEKALLPQFLKRSYSDKNSGYANLFIPLAFAFSSTFIIYFFFTRQGHSAPLMLYLAAILLAGYCRGCIGAFITIPAILFSAWLLLFNPVKLHMGNYTIAELVIFVLEGLLIAGLFYLIDRSLTTLRHSEKRFRSAFDKSAESIIMCDEELRIIYCCHSFYHLLGYHKEDLNHRKLIDFVHPEEIDTWRDTIDHLKERGKGSAFTSQRIKTAGGHWMWTESCINNLLNEKEVDAFIIYIRNITVRVDREVQQQNFLDMASHELRSPITAIKGFLQLMNNYGYENKDSYRSMIGRAEAQTEKMLHLVEDLLNVTKIKNGELHYHFEIADLNECIREVVAAIQAGHPKHRLDLQIPNKPTMILCDKMRLGQVLNNLINNAIKYSPDSQDIHVIATVGKKQVKITIKDHGIGIAMDKQLRVFDRFYRVDTLPKGKFNGLGLGLFIASEIIKQHNGKIGVDSKEGKGSSFWFTLPVSLQQNVRAN